MPIEHSRGERSLLWRDIFLFWWPVTARVVGVIGAFVALILGLVTHQPVNAAWLTFCGALVVAPAIFDSQDRANYRRVIEEDGGRELAAGSGAGGESSSTTQSSSSSEVGRSEPGSPSPSTSTSERDED